MNESTQTMKPWRSFEEQLKQLQERGLAVNDNAAALDYLERIGYYRLSGYWYSLREIDLIESVKQNKAVRGSTFIDGTQFEDVIRLYVFDKKLRLLALDALERIEMAVRVDIAHLLGKRHPQAHEQLECLHGNFTKKKIEKGDGKGKTPHQLWLEKYRAMLYRSRNEPFVQHHIKQYGALPIWVAVEIWDFGMLSKFFDGMQYADKEYIAKIYGAENGKSFAQWLRSLNFIRNVCAHHSRLWNRNMVEQSNIPKGWDTQLDKNRPFFFFCLMQQFMKVICPRSTWSNRLEKLLEKEFPIMSYSTINLDDFGLLSDWKDWELWKR